MLKFKNFETLSLKTSEKKFDKFKMAIWTINTTPALIHGTPLGVPHKHRPWKDLPALHLSWMCFQQPILPSGKGTRTHSIAVVAQELYPQIFMLLVVPYAGDK